MVSRVHELGRLSRTDLLAIYTQLLMTHHDSSQAATAAVSGWDRDQIITAIRNIEDPEGAITSGTDSWG